MIPPEVVRMRASSTVLAKASSLVNRDLAGISSRSDDHKVEKIDDVEQQLEELISNNSAPARRGIYSGGIQCQ
jgi:hypothetical protein